LTIYQHGLAYHAFKSSLNGQNTIIYAGHGLTHLVNLFDSVF
jgi:hypothetical protein